MIDAPSGGPGGDGRRWAVTVTVTTALASALNLILVLLTCLYVGPQVERGAEESRKNREGIEVNQRLILAVQKDLEETALVSRRLNELVDKAEAAAKAKADKDKAKGKK
jgi:hypothetical protein